MLKLRCLNSLFVVITNLAEHVEYVVVVFSDADHHTTHVRTLEPFPWGWIVILKRSIDIGIHGDIPSNVCDVFIFGHEDCSILK